ncbi:universal stress protein [Sphaerisporangium aureirubrum]|uniref:Universal stress protein n=1 Tax=Sphaerisporangium aureirubrum TaxID=1544736 RepID=A0ABW1NNY8_9ACTN
MTGQIVVGVDGSPSAAAAVDWAADDAGRRNARLRIVHVREPWSYDFPLRTGSGAGDGLPAYWRAALAAAADRVRARSPGLEVSVALITGAVSERLTTESADADEIVLGSEGRGGFAATVLGSVGQAVVGRASSPVVVVRRPAAATYGEIVVGFDGSAASEAALTYAIEQARLRGAHLLALHARNLPRLTVRRRDPLAEVAGAFRARLTPWAETNPDVSLTASAVRGHPVLALCRASRHADLLVVGTRTRPRGSPHLGSVAQAALRRAPCPVAVVHP